MQKPDAGWGWAAAQTARDRAGVELKLAWRVCKYTLLLHSFVSLRQLHKCPKGCMTFPTFKCSTVASNDVVPPPSSACWSAKRQVMLANMKYEHFAANPPKSCHLGEYSRCYFLTGVPTELFTSMFLLKYLNPMGRWLSLTWFTTTINGWTVIDCRNGRH